MSRKRVVLVSPLHHLAGSDRSSLSVVSLPSTPLAIVALGSYLRQNGVEVELIDVQMDFGFGLTEEAQERVAGRVADYLSRNGDEILWIGLSCLAYPHARSALPLARRIKAALPGIPVVFGGYFSTGYHRYLLKHHREVVDAIVCGDGEVAALQISRCLEKSGRLSGDGIPGLITADAWSDGTRPISAPPMDADELPPLDFGLLRHREQYPLAVIATSRGCPFRCNYCAESSMRSYSAIRPETLGRHLALYEKSLVATPLQVFDPIFGVGRERMVELTRLFRATKFTLAIESRADVLAPELVADLAHAGVEYLFLGVDSASLSTLKRMGKVRTRAHYDGYIAGAKEIATECFRHNVSLFLGVMLGYPGDTPADTRASLDLVQWMVEAHERVRRETGAAPGFVPIPAIVRAYPNVHDFEGMRGHPLATYREEPVEGEFVVATPSPEYSADQLREDFEAVERSAIYTPAEAERSVRYFGIRLGPFLSDHPHLVRDDVVVWGDSVVRGGDGSSFLTRYAPTLGVE